jgi:cation diffusion facilitator CzcD-associated flavoprotein CzcO
MRYHEHVRVAIVGSGFAGLGAAIRLKQEGIHDFVVLERGKDVGGVWRDNTYPGCACDVQSHLYSFSFAPKADWSRSYSPQREIYDYLRDCARRFEILPHVRFEHEVREARFDESDQRWHLTTSRGTLTADVLIGANGALSDPAIPRLPGLESFEGVAFHSARWNHDYDLTGQRVAVIGTGASAIQFVPAIQPKVARLTLFQRTAPWVLPRPNGAIPERARRLYRAFPATQKVVRSAIYALREAMHLGFREGTLMTLMERFARAYLARTVKDETLRAKLTPNYRIGCKRILLSDEYFPALVQPNVEVVTDGIREVRARSIVTNDGVEHEVDAIVFGTGFRVTDQPMAKLIRGRGGRTLSEVWSGSPRAHLGTTIAGFPNFFLLQGPNTGLGHTSVVIMIEAQIELVLAALRELQRTGAASIEPRLEAQARYNAEIDRAMEGSVWTAGGCASWYLDATGRNSTLWPGHTFTFAQRIRLDPRDFLFVAARSENRLNRSRFNRIVAT